LIGGVSITIAFFFLLELHWKQQIFELCKIKEVDLHALSHLWQLQLGCKFHFWWTQICQWEELSVAKRNTCVVIIPHGSHILCNGGKNVMIYIIGSMGCVHTYWRRFAIEAHGSVNYVQNVIKKIREDNWKVGTIRQIISQMLALGLKHDKIWAQ